VVAAKGYPGTPQRGDEIRGLERVAARNGVVLFHGGTRRVEQQIVADGGRVLVVAGVASTLATARDQAYSAVNLIDWPGGFFRRDIGARAIASPK
jgi:phosphoribosylamine---glycine ligase